MINKKHNKEFVLFDTNIFIYYFQWSNDKIPLKDQNKINIIKNIFNNLKNIIPKINYKILNEIKNQCENKKDLFFDKKFIQEQTDQDISNLIKLNLKQYNIIFEWYKKENGNFDLNDMEIFYLEQNNLKEPSNIIFTDNLKDFYKCDEIYKKYYLKHNLKYRKIEFKGIYDMKEYIK